jgi:hypothetical protein
LEARRKGKGMNQRQTRKQINKASHASKRNGNAYHFIAQDASNCIVMQRDEPIQPFL